MSRHPDIETIRRAIRASRGGHAATSDAGLLRLWLSLDTATRERYLAAIETAATDSADNDGRAIGEG